MSRYKVPLLPHPITHTTHNSNNNFVKASIRCLLMDTSDFVTLVLQEVSFHIINVRQKTAKRRSWEVSVTLAPLPPSYDPQLPTRSRRFITVTFTSNNFDIMEKYGAQNDITQCQTGRVLDTSGSTGSSCHYISVAWVAITIEGAQGAPKWSNCVARHPIPAATKCVAVTRRNFNLGSRNRAPGSSRSQTLSGVASYLTATTECVAVTRRNFNLGSRTRAPGSSRSQTLSGLAKCPKAAT
jgi:hypothetical protein